MGGGEFSCFVHMSPSTTATALRFYLRFRLTITSYRIAYMINENSIQFNIVSKGLGCERMSFYLNEAAGDIRDLMVPTLESPKAKL